MFGIIRSPGNYSDGQKSFEIVLYFEDDEKFPIIFNVRINHTLTIGESQYIGGVRSTEKSGSWISPDIYNLNNPSQRLRLSEVLLKNGFKINEEVIIFHNPERKELVINKK
jgi:hypothetical protein